MAHSLRQLHPFLPALPVVVPLIHIVRDGRFFLEGGRGGRKKKESSNKGYPQLFRPSPPSSLSLPLPWSLSPLKPDNRNGFPLFASLQLLRLLLFLFLPCVLYYLGTTLHLNRAVALSLFLSLSLSLSLCP